MRLNVRILSAAVVCGALVTPSAAGAAVTKTVSAGSPPNIKTIERKLIPHAKTFAKLYSPDVNAFFNKHTTINVGDTVSFKIDGFHTVDIPAKGGSDLPFVVSGPTVGTVPDAAGNPFWFSHALPGLGLNPALLGRSKSSSYNGSKRLDSGIVSSKPFNIKFTKAGTYKYFCDVHPDMIGYVVVKPKGKTIPTAKQDQTASDAQATRYIKKAVKLPKIKQPTDTVSLGESTSDGVELYAMFPASLTVSRGTTVTFRMSSHSEETHTATFGPVGYLKPLAKSFTSLSFSPIATYPSDPAQPLTLTHTSHGNGFANTGILDSNPTTTQIGPSSRIDFTTPGTYHYECLVHPFMKGTIIVK